MSVCVWDSEFPYNPRLSQLSFDTVNCLVTALCEEQDRFIMMVLADYCEERGESKLAEELRREATWEESQMHVLSKEIRRFNSTADEGYFKLCQKVARSDRITWVASRFPGLCFCKLLQEPIYTRWPCVCSDGPLQKRMKELGLCYEMMESMKST